MKLLTLKEIEDLHKKYAPTDEVFELVFTHCQIVWDVASQLIDAQTLDIDSDLIKAGCLLHDIGVYELYDENGIEREKEQYITHGVRGEAILKAEGFPEIISRFASHHTGFGLTKEDIRVLHVALPSHNYSAETTEEKLIMYADKFHSKVGRVCFNSFGWAKTSVKKFGNQKTAIFQELADEFGVPDLLVLMHKYGHELRN